MSDLPPPAAERRDVRRHGRRPAADARSRDGVRALHLRIAVLPAAAMGLLAVATVVLLLAAAPFNELTRVALAVAAAGAVLVLGASAYAAMSATRRLYRRLDSLRSLNARGHEDLVRLVEQAANGGRLVASDPGPPPPAGTDPFALLAHDLRKEQYAAQNALIQAVEQARACEPHQQMEVFVNVARRMQSLVHREIGLLDELESRVEDPDLLKGLFTIDHLATRMRRQSESLAVLGGAVSRRQWSKPVLLYEVLRSAVAEVEHYSRVKVVPPVEGTLKGSAVTDVIHLVAELIENATKFSPPATHVLLRAQTVTAGLVIEVEDRGLGIPAADQRRMNTWLADSSRIDIGELLHDGRIGLFVVSALARQHGIRVQLQSNVYGGTQAVVVLPARLLGTNPQDGDRRLPAQEQQPPPAPAQASPRRRPPAPSASRETAPGGLAVAAGPGPVVDARSAAPRGPANAPGDPAHRRRSGLPVREAGARSPREPGGGPAPARAEPPRTRPEDGGRPPLPQRRVQEHMAPELRAASPRRRGEADSDHSPGLMAAFRSGVDRAEKENEDENGSVDRAGGTS